ncbi:twitching motility protein PilJ [Sinobacterium caligoides]|uniref:Twitching motility protein PilJ n=1 Tax=Sinobacterium caligoides TaxID=933926 RepID=A0A3N2DGJ8_9GAMM|nr:methyl-accepting chemotaxis protein [Sinobacterium caligoides]ROR98920.1 twitching motility protein PilJ [Sinobacterium caligoides]
MSTTKNTTKSSNNGGTSLLIILLVLVIVGFAYIGFKLFQQVGHDSGYLKSTSDLRVLLQELTTSSRQATEGNAAAFTDLKEANAKFKATVNKLIDESNDQELLAPELDRLAKTWTMLDQSSHTIVENRDRILLLHEVANTLNESVPAVQAEYENVVEIMLDIGADTESTVQAQGQSLLMERIARNVDKMLEGRVDAVSAADQFSQQAVLFRAVLNGMLEGNKSLRITKVNDPEALASLKEITELYGFVAGSVDEIVQASPDLTKARDAAKKVIEAEPMMQDAIAALVTAIGNLDGKRAINTTMLAGLAVAILVLLALIGLSNARGTARQLKTENETNETNQAAILRLLDELADLADGDLTATATVSEDFTGAIADSINFTIDQLRILVSQINDTAVRVSSAAEETQGTALHLAEASEHQAQEIAGASAAINEMAVTIDQVSANASESAQVADRSVKIAGSGAEVVQNTIHGMDTIREQIQDTAKRIKRLGESSQEIGDIVSLINDIADQTNILALNAAIQASMAGDAGRGFAVVADEVQRLAERSSNATKQIEALVKTIQSDTNEAVISMEQTTSEVVRGARLAQDAGVALEEIENVSSSLAELIQNISNAARQQAASAGHISNTMNVIQEITSQTSSGTTTTAKSIGNLAVMATDLRESVAGFKLPEEELDFDDELQEH